MFVRTCSAIVLGAGLRDDRRRSRLAVVEAHEGFEEFFERTEPRLRHAFTALYGRDVAADASAEALSWALEHWGRVQAMEYPVGYLYRVGQSRTRRLRRRSWPVATMDDVTLPEFDPRLGPALAELPERQRVCVMLVHGYGWSHGDVAALLSLRASTVATHVSRALARLQARLEVYEHD
jgi:RNA polymerase sigma factor (sigma-70 family)